MDRRCGLCNTPPRLFVVKNPIILLRLIPLRAHTAARSQQVIDIVKCLADKFTEFTKLEL